jgi:hypothetical protein
MAGVITLLNQGHLAEAWEHVQALGPLPAGGHESLISKLLEGWFSLTPEQQATTPALKDDPSADFQFVPATHSDTILLVFCGMAQRFGGCPLPLIHCYLGRLGVHLLYLRDHDNLFYLNGQRRDHYNFVQTLERIRALSEQHGAKRFQTIGTSSGGFGALHWGIELLAERIVSLAGPTDLRHILANLRERQAALGIPEPYRANTWAADAVSRLRQPGPQPRFHLIYAAENTNDVRFAQNLGYPLAPHISVEALQGSDAHNVLIPILEQDRLASLLMHLVAPTSGMALAPTEPPSALEDRGHPAG